MWDAASGAELLVLRGHEQSVKAAAFSPDGASDRERVLMTVRCGCGTRRAGRELLVLRGHEGRVYAAAFSPDGDRIVSGSEDGTVRVWDAASGARAAGPARP